MTFQIRKIYLLMNFKWVVNKFWVEVIGIVLSLSAAVVTAITSAPSGRTEKIAVSVCSAGIFFAILRSRFDVLKELSEYKNSTKMVKDAIDLYIKVTEAIDLIELPRLRLRAKSEIDQLFKKIQELAQGHIILEPTESMFHQAAMVRSAKKEIFAIHTVKDRRDLLKWLKKDGEFNVLKHAYTEAKGRLAPGTMTRVFVVASELTAEKECMELLRQVKELSEKQLGFKSPIVLREISILDKQAYLSLLLVDRSGLVVVQIEPGDVREFKIVAYEGKGLENMLSQNNFAAWMDLQRADDMSSECFAGINPSGEITHS